MLRYQVGTYDESEARYPLFKDGRTYASKSYANKVRSTQQNYVSNFLEVKEVEVITVEEELAKLKQTADKMFFLLALALPTLEERWDEDNSVRKFLEEHGKIKGKK